MTTQTCFACKRDLPLTDFPRNSAKKRRKTGRDKALACGSCMSAWVEKLVEKKRVARASDPNAVNSWTAPAYNYRDCDPSIPIEMCECVDGYWRSKVDDLDAAWAERMDRDA